MAKHSTSELLYGGLTVIPNNVINDRNLSFDAKGLYAYILSLPDNSKFSPELIMERTPDSPETIEKAFRELMEAGLLRKFLVKSEDSESTIQWIVELPENIKER